MKAKELNAQIFAEASEWLVEFRSGDIDARGRKEFYVWLRTSPEHMRAYLELAAIWNEGHSLDLKRHFDDTRLAADVKANTNVTPFHSNTLANAVYIDTVSAARQPKHSWRFFSLAASAILAASSLWYANTRDVYATAVGEQRVVILNDGSTVELNSNSRVRVNYSKGIRGINLVQGQALFHVAKDHSRPFIVRTDNAQVRAVGTQFDVYRNREATTVTVIEGTVAVLPTSPESSGQFDEIDTRSNSASIRGSHAADSIVLSRGDQVTVAPSVQPKSVRANVATATAWTQQELVFNGTSLEDVVAEFNRYNKRHLTIRGSEIASLKITGIFASTDPSSLIRFLMARSDITVTEEDGEFLISQRH